MNPVTTLIGWWPTVSERSPRSTPAQLALTAGYFVVSREPKEINDEHRAQRPTPGSRQPANRRSRGGGALSRTVSGHQFDVRDPATQELICGAADATAEDVEIAVAGARGARPAWASLPARDRGKLLIEGARILSAHAEELALLLTLESGKALRTECRSEAANLADVLQFFGGLASEIKGETVPVGPGVLAYTKREPVGVVAAVLPWNIPLMLMAVKIAPALVAGNPVIVKSAEETPLAVLRADRKSTRL